MAVLDIKGYLSLQEAQDFIRRIDDMLKLEHVMADEGFVNLLLHKKKIALAFIEREEKKVVKTA